MIPQVPESEPTLRLKPGRALLHPLWWTALIVLVVNDHFLKHSDLAGVVTGKLSDVAGLIVAPVLLATLLGVRTRRGLWLSAGAVGAVFSTINLSPAAARWWDMLVSAVALPYHTTPDPTDLLALAALPLGIWLLSPAMRRPWSVQRRRTKRLTTYGLTVAGALACMATSPPSSVESWDPWGAEMEARVSLLNLTHELHVIRVRHLLPEIGLDCDLVAEDPPTYLRSDLFGVSRRWEVFSGQEIPLSPVDDWGMMVPDNRGCQAALVELDSASDLLVFWSRDLPIKFFERDADIPKDVPADPQTVILEADYSEVAPSDLHEWRYRPCQFFEDCRELEIEAARTPVGTRYSWRAQFDGELFYERANLPSPPAVEIPEACEMPGPGMSLVWEEPPAGEWDVMDFMEGRDGCHSLALHSSVGDFERYWRVCAPTRALAALLPVDGSVARIKFQPIDQTQGAPSRRHEGLMLEVAVYNGEMFSGSGSIYLTRGYTLPSHLGINWQAEPREGCAPQPDTCDQIAVPIDVRLNPSTQGNLVRPGERSPVGSGQTRTFYLIRALQRAVADSGCEAMSFLGQAGAVPGPYLEAVTVLGLND